jgi:hypothetical protein
MKTGIEPAMDESGIRRRSVGMMEGQDPSGRRRTVALGELNDADRALAEQFGYKPVCERHPSESDPLLTLSL